MDDGAMSKHRSIFDHLGIFSYKPRTPPFLLGGADFETDSESSSDDDLPGDQLDAFVKEMDNLERWYDHVEQLRPLVEEHRAGALRKALGAERVKINIIYGLVRDDAQRNNPEHLQKIRHQLDAMYATLRNLHTVYNEIVPIGDKSKKK